MTGHVPYNKINWTPKMLQYIRDNFHTLTNQQLADGLGLKLTSVRTQCISMGLKRMEMEYWTDEQVAYLKLHYQAKGDTELAIEFNVMWYKAKGWHKKHIEKKRRYLRLKRTVEQKKAIAIGHSDKGVYSRSMQRIWSDVRVAAPIGDKRMWMISGTHRMVIKLKSGWVCYGHWLYEQIHGSVPIGHVVRLKDGDPANVVLDNLMLVTRSENATMNTERYRAYPPELKEVIKINNKLSKRIKQIEQDEK